MTRSKILFLISMFVSSIGRNGYCVGMAWIVLTQTNQIQSVAMLFVAGAIAEFFVSAFAGFLADRWDRRVICVAADLARILIMLPTAYFATTHFGVAAYFLMAAYCTADRVYMTAIQSIIPSISPLDDLVSFNSWSYVGMQAGNLAGAFCVGFLLHSAPDQVAFVCLMICFLTSMSAMVGLLQIPFLYVASNVHGPTIVPGDAPPGNILKVTVFSKLRKITIVYAQIYTTGILINILLAGYVLRELRGGSMEFGNLESGWAIGSVVVSGLLTLRVFKNAHGGGVLPALFFSGLTMFAFGFVSSFIPALAGVIILGAIYNVARILIDVKIQRSVPDAFLGRTKGGIQSVCMGFGLIVYGVIAFLGDDINPSAIFKTYGVLMLVSATFLYAVGIARRVISSKQAV